ncbi:MAG: response regulator, partial [Opitutaceae bacterium]|nr:response regulator [Opitutaceae bacterium]
MKRILIIDDQEDVRAELRDRIESMNHESEEAASQDEAIRKLEDLAYDCVLLDLSIPLKNDGVTRIDHGRNLLQRIVAMPSAPPVIVITSHGLNGHKLAVEMINLGAATFVGKPFEDDPVEPKIQMVLDRKGDNGATAQKSDKAFSGGVLVLNDDGIELCGVTVGGVRGNAIIRRVVEMLAQRTSGKFRKASAQTLADALPTSVTPPTVTSAINEFRSQCTEKLAAAHIKCGKNDVILTVKGGGYQFAPGIEVRVGNEETPALQVDQDCELLLKQFRRRNKMTVKQVRDSVEIPA